MNIPYTILSSAVSLDGFLNDTSDDRLLLSNEDDFKQVDALRSDCDGILIGAHTLRTDNPSLVIRTPAYVQQRVQAKKPQYPARITLTSSGNLPPSHSFFAHNGSKILVYCSNLSASNLVGALNETPAEVIPMNGSQINLKALLLDLKKRGIHKLLIEGGQHIATRFLTAGLVHELRVAIAPFFVGEPGAPRLVGGGSFPFDKHNRMHLQQTELVGDMAVLTYKLQVIEDESDY